MFHGSKASCIVGFAAMTVAACAAHPRLGTPTYVRAQAVSDPPPAQAPAASPAPASSPPVTFGGQMKHLPPRAAGPGSDAANRPSPQQVVSDANRKASQAPGRGDYFNAIVQYAFDPGTLYQVFAAPMRITDIALEPGEKILGQPASGDVVRWILALGKSMDHGVEQWHVYLKPTRPELETNLAINTDRRSYLLELHSYADTYMAAVVWHYPEDDAARLSAQVTEADAEQRSTAPVVGIDALHFDYTIQVVQGTPAWTPLQAFDDGRHTFVRFPPAMTVREAPALFVLRDKETQLVNYRVKGDTYVIDRLIDAAELRVGQQEQEIVRILRGSPPPPARLRSIHGG
jgi:type IV secretion system protein VirB9